MQLSRLYKDGYFLKYENNKKVYIKLDVEICNIQLEEDNVTKNKIVTDVVKLCKKNKVAEKYDIVIPECRSVYYLIKDDYWSKEYIDKGKIFLSDNEAYR